MNIPGLNIKINTPKVSLILLLFLFFGMELADKLSLYYFPDYSFSQYVKAIVLMGVLAYQIIIKDFKSIAFVLVLFISYFIGQLLLEISFSRNSILTFFKFLFPILLFAYLNKQNLQSERSSNFFKTFEYLMVVNSILILLGILLSIQLFNTYQGDRFGFNGVFNAVSTGSYAYIITLMYFLLSYKEKVIHNWKFILIFISCFFIGTKAVYLTMAFSIAYIVTVSKIPFKKTLLAIATLSGLLIAYYFFFHYGIFNSIRQTDGLLTALLSYRDEQFREVTVPYINENWNLINYLFGGVSNFDLRSQMDLIDVFFFWGILGGAFYLYVFFKLFLSFKLNKTGLVFVAFLAFIVLLAGNFFVYSFVALFLLVLKLILESKGNKSTNL